MNRLFTLAVAAILLVGCADGPSKQTIGTGLGGIGGGLAGAQFGRGSGNLAATAGGALLGALVGNSIGASLDRADSLAAGPAYGISSPPTFYAPTPPAAYQPQPGYAAPPTGSPYAVSGASTPVFAAPSMWNSPGRAVPGGCRTVGNGIWCE